VPPFEIPTAAAYGRWDDLDEPEGPAVSGRDLPPNCVCTSPWSTTWCLPLSPWHRAWGDWIADLRRRWGRAVLMSGSGPALFSFFPSASEAGEAAVVPGARAARACRPVPAGWQVPAGTLA